MSEREAIKSLKEFAYKIHGTLSAGEAKIVLNLIEKLQKENEDLKEAYDNCFEVASETRRDLINQLADCQEYIDYINNEEMDNLWEENLNM